MISEFGVVHKAGSFAAVRSGMRLRTPGKLVGVVSHPGVQALKAKAVTHAMVHGPKYMKLVDDPIGLNPFINKGEAMISEFGVVHDFDAEVAKGLLGLKPKSVNTVWSNVGGKGTHGYAHSTHTRRPGTWAQKPISHSKTNSYAHNDPKPHTTVTTGSNKGGLTGKGKLAVAGAGTGVAGATGGTALAVHSNNKKAKR